MIRGIERRDIFLDDADRRDLLRRLSRILPESRCRCFAWALMPNHTHLVVRTGDAPIGRVMSRVGTGYAGYFNRRYGRAGYLFQNRFKSRIVSDDSDLMNLIRYVHLNPISGGIVRSLDELERFPWCGHAALMGGHALEFHQAADTLSLYGEEPTTARRSLRDFMQMGVRVEPAKEERDPDPSARLTRIITEACRLQGIDPADLHRGRRDRQASNARKIIVGRAMTELGISKAAIARGIGATDSAVNYWLRQDRMLRDR